MSSAPEPPPPDAEEVAWNQPQPAHAPAPSYAPAGLALGIGMAAWGIVTHWVMSIAGALLFVAALGYWLAEIRNDWRSDDA